MSEKVEIHGTPFCWQSLPAYPRRRDTAENHYYQVPDTTTVPLEPDWRPGLLNYGLSSWETWHRIIYSEQAKNMDRIKTRQYYPRSHEIKPMLGFFFLAQFLISYKA